MDNGSASARRTYPLLSHRVPRSSPQLPGLEGGTLSPLKVVARTSADSSSIPIYREYREELPYAGLASRYRPAAPSLLEASGEDVSSFERVGESRPREPSVAPGMDNGSASAQRTYPAGRTYWLQLSPRRLPRCLRSLAM